MLKYLYVSLCLISLGLPLACLADESGLALVQRYEMDGGHVLFYDDDSMSVTVRYADAATNITLAEDFCSPPVLAPDAAKAVFLHPYDFETISDLMLFDAATRQLHALELDDVAFQHTPMRMTWLDDNILLVIVGYGYGTVARGGDVYYYDLGTGVNAKIIDAANVEIVNISVVKNWGPAKENGLLLEFLGPEYGYMTGRYYHTLPRTQTHTLLPMEDVRELLRQSGLTATYDEKPQDAVMNRLTCLAGWLLAQTAFN